MEFALPVEKYELPLVAEAMTENHKQFGFVRFAFPGFKNFIGDERDPERDEPVLVTATKSGELGAARRLRFEQSPNTLLQEVVSGLSQPEDLMAALFAEPFLTAVPCFTASRHRFFLGARPVRSASMCQKKSWWDGLQKLLSTLKWTLS